MTRPAIELGALTIARQQSLETTKAVHIEIGDERFEYRRGELEAYEHGKYLRRAWDMERREGSE